MGPSFYAQRRLRHPGTTPCQFRPSFYVMMTNCGTNCQFEIYLHSIGPNTWISNSSLSQENNYFTVYRPRDIDVSLHICCYWHRTWLGLSHIKINPDLLNSVWSYILHVSLANFIFSLYVLLVWIHMNSEFIFPSKVVLNGIIIPKQGHPPCPQQYNSCP